METVLRLARSRKTRVLLNVFSVAVALAVGALAVIHFRHEGWPLARASVGGIVGAGILFLLAYAFKALGWRRLFAPEDRPDRAALVAAGGAASVTGIALPGRFDEVVRIAVVRKFPGKRTGLGTICLSLLLLGLIDSAALTPLAAVAAGVSGASGLFTVALAIVSAAGIGAALIVFAMPRLTRTRFLSRFRVAHWIGEHCACPREASKAWAFVSVSWLLRGGALVLLLHAFGVGASVPLALAFLCASAASAALPVAPAGAATQAGAGAAILIASGVSASQAVAFALAAQTLLILAGAAVVTLAGVWGARAMLLPART